MTSSPHTKRTVAAQGGGDQRTVRRDEIADWNASLCLAIGNYADLGARPWNEVRRIEIFPDVPVDAEPITVPEHWLPPGVLRRLSFRSVYLTRALSKRSPRNAGQVAKADETVRRTLLALWLPRQTNTGVRRYKPSSWIGTAGLVVRVANWVLDNRPSIDGSLWSHLLAADWLSIQEALAPGSEYRRQSIRTLVRWLIDYGRRGVLSDYPWEFEQDRQGPTNAPERTRRGAKPAWSPRSAEKHFQPLPDQFVTELMWRGIWLNENLSVQLIDCWKELQRINGQAAVVGRGSKHPVVIEEKRRLISSIAWRDATGQRICRLPFAVTQKEGTWSCKSDVWPPEASATVNILVGIVQALNICQIAFCTGARISEIESAGRRSLIVEGGDVRFQGRTYKLAASFGGVERDWPLHPIAGWALQVQYRLAEAVQPYSRNDYCWVLLRQGEEGGIGSPLRNLNEPVVKAVHNLGLTHLLDGIRPHMHRWRHTVARLVALSVVGASQVLMDLFGHRDFEMTLRYILSHPDIAQEALRVAKETAYALAEGVITETLGERTGGRGAEELKGSLDRIRMRQGLDEFGTSTLRDTTEVLTFGGRTWQLVRDGVLCTKRIDQTGPCTRSRGAPDPGSCHTDCIYRAEMERTRAQCSETIHGLTTELEDAMREGRVMLVENLSGQLLAQLKRWEDIRAHWLSRSALAREIWEARKH